MTKGGGAIGGGGGGVTSNKGCIGKCALNISGLVGGCHTDSAGQKQLTDKLTD